MAQAGRELAEKGDVSPETRGRLIVDYPPEVRKRLVEGHNQMSRRITPTASRCSGSRLT